MYWSLAVKKHIDKGGQITWQTSTSVLSAAIIPLDSKVSSDAGDTTLSTLFSSSGASACIVPFAAASNIQVSHVVVATNEVWDKVEALKGSGVQ